MGCMDQLIIIPLMQIANLSEISRQTWVIIGMQPLRTPPGAAERFIMRIILSTLPQLWEQIRIGDAQVSSPRYVYRYNTINSSLQGQPWIDWHGYYINQVDQDSSKGVEVYGNYFNISGPAAGNMISARGGKSFIFYNNLSAASVADLKVYTDECPKTYVTQQLMNNTYFWRNYKNNSTLLGVYHDAQQTCAGAVGPLNPQENQDWFRDSGSAPYVACGTPANLPKTCTVGQGYWATTQSCSNLTGMVGVNPTTPISGTLYKCTSTNTWTLSIHPIPILIH